MNENQNKQAGTEQMRDETLPVPAEDILMNPDQATEQTASVASEVSNTDAVNGSLNSDVKTDVCQVMMSFRH